MLLSMMLKLAVSSVTSVVCGRKDLSSRSSQSIVCTMVSAVIHKQCYRSERTVRTLQNKDEVREQREKTCLASGLCIRGGLAPAKQSNLVANPECFR